MKISELIEFWQKELKKHGDVDIHSAKDDGRSSWVSPYVPRVVLERQQKRYAPRYMHQDAAY